MDRLFAKKQKPDAKETQAMLQPAPAPMEAPKESRVEVDPILRVEEAAGFAEEHARALRTKEESMPSLEEAAPDEKAEVMRLDAESDAWSKISGIFYRTSNEGDGAARLARIRNELAVLRHTSLDKGPEADIIKLQAIEQIEKTLRS